MRAVMMFAVRCRVLFKTPNRIVTSGTSGFHSTQINNGEINFNKKSISEFYQGKSVFLTGGSGFLGKVFIQKLLDNCLGIENIYLLIRDKKGVKIENRVNEIINNELFRSLKETQPQDFKKIVPIAGDVTLPNLGISPEHESILKEKVSVVIHSAANVRFFDPLSIAMKINVEGTKKVLDLAKKMPNIQAFVHISTAYANSERKVIDEVVYPPPKSIKEVYKFIERGHTQEELIKFLSGKPNTYTFTKCITEKYIEENHGDLPTAIVRPSIVTTTAKPPLVGWLDNWAGISKVVYDVAAGYSRVIPGDGTNIIDLIPVDYSANLAVVAAARCPQTEKLTVYNSCSSGISPVTADQVYKVVRDETVRSKANVIPYPTLLYARNKATETALTYLLQYFPAYMADLYLNITKKQPKYVKLQDKVVIFREAVKYFTTGNWVFICRNVTDLHKTMSPIDQERFPVSPHDINWKEYIENYGKGIRKYLVEPESK